MTSPDEITQPIRTRAAGKDPSAASSDEITQPIRVPAVQNQAPTGADEITQPIRLAGAVQNVPTTRREVVQPDRRPSAVQDQPSTRPEDAVQPIRRPGAVKHRSFWLGIAMVGLFVIAALAAPLLAPPDPNVKFSTFRSVGELNKMAPIPPRPGLILGSVPDRTNLRQLDVWYTLIWGTSSALRFGLLVVLLAAVFGTILGVVSAYLGGLANSLLMGFTDAFLAFPLIAGVIFFQQFILVLLRSTGVPIYARGLWALPDSPTAWQTFLAGVDPLMLAFIVFSWMPYARLMNTVVQRARQEEYILAVRSLGAGHLRLIFRHLLPNSISPAIVQASRDVGYLVLLQAGFTFIGLSSSSEWGVLLSLGRNYVIGPGGSPFTWWWVFLPITLAIVLFGIGWNLLGDGLNDRLNRF